MSDWKPPLKCRWFKHKFVASGYAVQIQVFADFAVESSVEICSKCGGGRFMMPFSGWQCYSPDAVQKFLMNRQAEADGKLIEANFATKIVRSVPGNEKPPTG